MDYLKYYDLEKYLFSEVSSNFRRDGYLHAFDFFCIIIWKANRAKSKIAKKLLDKSKVSSLEEAVKLLTSSIAKEKLPRERLFILIKTWEIPLPTASAILTVLYPNEFTVYDYRVCDILEKYHEIVNRSNFDEIWKEYQNYKEDVSNYVKSQVSLRDKDRIIWGESFFKQLQNDINHKFKNNNENEN